MGDPGVLVWVGVRVMVGVKVMVGVFVGPGLWNLVVGCADDSPQLPTVRGPIVTEPPAPSFTSK